MKDTDKQMQIEAHQS